MAVIERGAAAIADRRVAAACGLVGMLVAFSACTTARAQAPAQPLTVLPVSIEMAPGQMATTLTVINQGDSATSLQVRAFAWTQPGSGDDQLAATDDLLASPPLATVAAGATQVVRMVLRRPPQGQEASFRLLLDQLPPPAAPGTVRFALRLSIPVLAEPATRVAPHVQWRVESGGGLAWLVAANDGSRHATVHDIALAAAGGAALKVGTDVSPYILAGATRRWRILTPGLVPPLGSSLHLTAHGDVGPPIDQIVQVGQGS
jgi:fimbrial chaperone protein